MLASQLLADTLARTCVAVQAFPEFTAERRGAPISAFVRWDASHPIRRRYKIGDCEVLLGISQSLPGPDVLRRVRPDGLVLLNHAHRVPLAGAFRLARAPASRIARERGIDSSEGRPLGNTALLGAAVRLLAPDALDFLEQAITARMGRLAAPNVAAARDGYARCTRQRRRAGDPVADRVDQAEGLGQIRPPFPISTVDSHVRLTGAWSFDRPLLTDACTACALCSVFCPEGALVRRDDVMVVDYDHCKGCGICANVCPVRCALVMDEIAA